MAKFKKGDLVIGNAGAGEDYRYTGEGVQLVVGELEDAGHFVGFVPHDHESGAERGEVYPGLHEDNFDLLSEDGNHDYTIDDMKKAHSELEQKRIERARSGEDEEELDDFAKFILAMMKQQREQAARERVFEGETLFNKGQVVKVVAENPEFGLGAAKPGDAGEIIGIGAHPHDNTKPVYFLDLPHQPAFSVNENEIEAV